MLVVRPRFERLEERNLLHSGHAINIFLDAILYSPVGPGEPLAEHVHPHLSIFIDGVQQVIPADIGIHEDVLGLAHSQIAAMPIHTHDESGTLHVESLVPFQFHLDDFFAIWGQTFNSQEILGHHADASHPITMTVNGEPSTLFGDLPLQGQPHGAAFSESGDQIVITLDGVP